MHPAPFHREELAVAKSRSMDESAVLDLPVSDEKSDLTNVANVNRAVIRR